MNPFDQQLQERLSTLRAQGLHRELRRVDSAQGPRIEINQHTLLNFASNDYLGLANDPALKQFTIDAVHKFGAGAGASRLTSGSLAVYHLLDAALAGFKNTPAALSFSSGYATAIGAITALVGKDDIIIVDKLVHASIVDAARLSGAKLRVFDHNDPGDLETILQWADKNKITIGHQPSAILIVTESVFSMDGDAAPLREIVELKNRYGAWLMVDEAHATGLYGAHRRGLAEELGVSDQIEIHMGTLGKAFGASGGYIGGSRALIDYLVNQARSFIFSTAPAPAAAAAAIAGIQFVESDEGARRREQLWQRVGELHAALNTPRAAFRSAIIPVILGDEQAAVDASSQLRDQGIFVPAIRFPTVARGSARLRITLTAAHSSEDVARLASALAPILHHRSKIKT